MTLAHHEFIRRFLLHVLAKGFHRIRHYGLLASATCKANIARAKELSAAPLPSIYPSTEHDDADVAVGAAADHHPPCPCCGGGMIVVESFGRGGAPRPPPSPTAHPMPSIRPKSPRRPPGAKLATAIVDPLPFTPASHPLRKPPPRQMPIDSKPPTQPPRVPSREAFGRRPSERVDRSRRAGIRNPCSIAARVLNKLFMPAARRRGASKKSCRSNVRHDRG
jgi:hypothetical protein